ncbi:MAG: archaetidylserine decarboxylase, partial [Polyangiales bacterium]
HGVINRTAELITGLRSPRWAVDAAIAAWVKRDRIELRDFEDRRFESLSDFFLRRLRDGARPIGAGLVAPCDGRIVGSGRIERDTILQVKGIPLSVDRLVHGARPTAPRWDLSRYEGGAYVTTFLSPRGYHYVHAPLAAHVADVRWIAGRFFPQNEDALRHIPGIYERNERAVLRLRVDAHEVAMVLVGASVIGGIELRDLPRHAWVGPAPYRIDRAVTKGEELGHFRFGSTVVLLLPPALVPAALPAIGRDVQMGEALQS